MIAFDRRPGDHRRIYSMTRMRAYIRHPGPGNPLQWLGECFRNGWWSFLNIRPAPTRWWIVPRAPGGYDFWWRVDR